jgi:hypothetical protein
MLFRWQHESQKLWISPRTILQQSVALCRSGVWYILCIYMQFFFVFFSLLCTYTCTAAFGLIGYLLVYRLLLHCRCLQGNCYSRGFFRFAYCPAMHVFGFYGFWRSNLLSFGCGAVMEVSNGWNRFTVLGGWCISFCFSLNPNVNKHSAHYFQLKVLNPRNPVIKRIIIINCADLRSYLQQWRLFCTIRIKEWMHGSSQLHSKILSWPSSGVIGNWI